MKILLEGKAFELKFGFKCFMLLGKDLGLETFNEVVQKFTSFADIKDDISFDQLELIEKLVVAAVEAHPDYYKNEPSIHDVSVIDGLMEQPDVISEIMTAFGSSFPKTEGKPKAGPKPRKKK